MTSRTPLRVHLFAAALLLAGLAWAQPAPQPKPRWSPEHEKKVGAEAAVEIEKKWKVLDDPDNLKKLTEIVTTIAAVSGRPEVKYTVKIVDSTEVNAFTIPGGYVYVTKGLLADAQSDSELAGVLAHEITHNVFYDALDGAKKNQKLFMGSLAAAVGAMLLGGKGNTVTAALSAGEYIRLGIMCQYSLDVETRADSYAVKYLLAGKKYNPVGMLTFMERLAAQERHKPKRELGVYADHPDTDIRCRMIMDQLEASDVDLNRRAVTKWDPAKAEEKDVAGLKVPVVRLWGVDLLKVQTAAEAPTALDRAKGLADGLTQSLAAGLGAYEIRADVKSPQPRVLLGDRVWLTISAGDAQAAGVTPAELANQVAASLGAAMHKEELERWW
ncbi:MAG: M48 family metalloprotease [Armatimonadota bacterium]